MKYLTFGQKKDDFLEILQRGVFGVLFRPETDEMIKLGFSSEFSIFGLTMVSN